MFCLPAICYGQTVPKIAVADQSIPERLRREVVVLTMLNRSKRENFMGSTADKIKGAANEAAGKAKQGVGEAVGSDQMQGEGAAQELKGKGQKAVGDAKQAAKDVANKAAGAANKNL
jgi:uncharacterized protein YjbJ (UPF0337 family)